MNSNTKFFTFINDLGSQSQIKFWLFEKTFPVSILSLFFGFFCGNLFGSFLNFFRNYIAWDGIIIIITILFIEFINYISYAKNPFRPTSILKRSQVVITNQQKSNFIRLFNFYKIGLLIGFFTDAFKVGS